ncbi:MAG: hypothetical protein K0Q64_2114 [Nitrobacter vulgaris]|jgi:hypothetical protein|nr:hypothetical protein [Nitrobacter vulgaris]
MNQHTDSLKTIFTVFSLFFVLFGAFEPRRCPISTRSWPQEPEME